MRLIKITIACTVVVVACALVNLPLFAQYHASGSLVCSDCHTMHYSEEGAVPTGADAGGPWRKLLKRSSVSDLCLNCHQVTGGDANAPKVYGNPLQTTPGGSFDSVAGAAVANGHDVGGTLIGSDTTPANGPGGAFAASGLTCASCHDPHGTGGTVSFAYRNLYKTVNAVDVSATITSTNANEADIYDEVGSANKAINATNHNVYKGDFGGWCAACHGSFHGDTKADADVGNGTDWIRHPTFTAFTAGIATNYGANSNFAYPMVTTAAGALTTAEWAIVAAESKVFCLSCHQAHASTNANATRWNNAAASPTGGNCNKCHGK